MGAGTVVVAVVVMQQQYRANALVFFFVFPFLVVAGAWLHRGRRVQVRGVLHAEARGADAADGRDGVPRERDAVRPREHTGGVLHVPATRRGAGSSAAAAATAARRAGGRGGGRRVWWG